MSSENTSNVDGNQPTTITRRSLRSKSGTACRTRRSNWYNLSPYWRKQYLDLGHCRLKKCTVRMQEASAAQLKELQDSYHDQERCNGSATFGSFVALAIVSAANGSLQKEHELLEYVQTVLQKTNLNPNDTYKNDTAVTLAAYHGFTEVLQLLLSQEGCSIDNPMGHFKDHGEDAIQAAVRNGKHKALELLLKQRPEECKSLLLSPQKKTIAKAIYRGDVQAVRLLRDAGALTTDFDILYLQNAFRRGKKWEKQISDVLRGVYPEKENVSHWCKELHWSFPIRDRHVINIILWHCCSNSTQSSNADSEQRNSLKSQASVKIIPKELWLHIFSFFGRGWCFEDSFRKMSRLEMELTRLNK